MVKREMTRAKETSPNSEVVSTTIQPTNGVDHLTKIPLYK